MPKYKKKSIIVDAEQFKVNNETFPPGVYAKKVEGQWFYYCDTFEGTLFVQDLDWIVTGIKGEHYPIKPEIFAQTYEPADGFVEG